MESLTLCAEGSHGFCSPIGRSHAHIGDGDIARVRNSVVHKLSRRYAAKYLTHLSPNRLDSGAALGQSTHLHDPAPASLSRRGGCGGQLNLGRGRKRARPRGRVLKPVVDRSLILRLKREPRPLVQHTQLSGLASYRSCRFTIDGISGTGGAGGIRQFKFNKAKALTIPITQPWKRHVCDCAEALKSSLHHLVRDTTDDGFEVDGAFFAIIVCWQLARAPDMEAIV
mmetsp:Transcript_16469/g.42249  ORF Transcript_16469/g.42249 Transcript_16469/m.42249 type:complete len:226 (+) Transcript_16469:509-1186(+)